MSNKAYEYLRANLAEFIIDNDKLDHVMKKCEDISDHVFSAVLEQFDLGNDGTWQMFVNSPAFDKFNEVDEELHEVAWLFKWLYQSIGEPNLLYLREVYDGKSI